MGVVVGGGQQEGGVRTRAKEWGVCVDTLAALGLPQAQCRNKAKGCVCVGGGAFGGGGGTGTLGVSKCAWCAGGRMGQGGGNI
jgi:hypothetical protein